MDSSTKIGILAVAAPGFVALTFLFAPHFVGSKAFRHESAQRATGLILPSESEKPVRAGKKIIGRASVIDGDTIEIRGQRIRLHGIDAPESSQLCEKDSHRFRCGQKSANFLASLTGARNVICTQRDTDRYGRTVAKCRVEDIDLGIAMILNGWAIAYRKYEPDYVSYEDKARETGKGIWGGNFISPQRWRAGERL